MRLVLGSVVADLETGGLWSTDTPGVSLTPVERRILAVLFEAGESGSSYDALLREAWGLAEGWSAPSLSGDRLIHALEANKNRVQRALVDLRRKLRPSESIVTLHGFGYRLVEARKHLDQPEAPWPPDLPAPGPLAARLLDQAAEVAQARVHDHLGVEHLALALPAVEGGGLITSWVRARVGPMRSSLESDGLAPELMGADGQAPAGALSLTPRLRRLAAGLAPHFEPDALWSAICSDARQPLGLLHGGLRLSRADQTVTRSVRPAPAAQARFLEVVGGPEDGRRVTPRAGDTLGRRSLNAPPTHQLYERSRMVDLSLSRQHLVWLGSDQVRIQRRVDLTRGLERRELHPGEHTLEVGDLLHLTPHSLLWLCAEEGAMNGVR